MKFDALAEWRKFEAALIQELKATPLAEFKSAWQEGPLGDRFRYKNQFYNKLIGNVAAHLEYDSNQEYLRIDHVFLNEDRVPVVFIECENNHETVGLPFHEIDNLCAVNSPVKALFLSCSWADSEREKFLSDWKERIGTYRKYFDQNAVFMIVVGEWGRGSLEGDGILRYYIESFSISGEEIDRKEIELGAWEIEDAAMFTSVAPAV